MISADRDADIDPALDPTLDDEPEEEVELDIETLEGESLDLEASTDRIRKGRATIANFASTLPEKPGVYRMLNGAGEVLYVGKAKSLRKRVQSYARGVAHTDRVRRMIAQTVGMEFVVTGTETEALLLEANLIKQLRPRYNVLLRDDKSFPYIVITREHAAPQITKHRGARNRKADYYGPFASVWAVNRTLNALQRAFLLRSCTDSVYENRTRPCLLHQIKRCSGPCTNEVSPQAYADLVAQARAFMSGKSSLVKNGMAAEMQRASADMEFERAARYRDRLAALSAVQSSQDINTQIVEEADVFAIAEQAGVFCVEVFFFRNHQNWGNRSFFPKADRSLTLAEVLSSFLVQFYDDKPAPGLILLSQGIDECDLVAEALSQSAGKRVCIEAPKRGEKRNLALSAEKNAREGLARRLADTAAQSKLLTLLGDGFKLPGAPRRVEVYDNSHIMGTNAVGAMIVAGPQGFMRTHYRTFNMQSDELTPGDDFGMMREVLKRRFSRLVKENPRGEGGAEPDPEAFPAWPDLVIIDGGRGQLNAALQTLADVGVTDVPLVGIAKGPDRNAGRETFHMPERDSFRLQPRDPVLYFVQRMRDEAHRFAIGAHRAKRKRDITRNPLDEVPGIGPRRKRALLLHFGTVKAIRRASLDDLSGAPGVNAATAKAVYDFFQGGAG